MLSYFSGSITYINCLKILKDPYLASHAEEHLLNVTFRLGALFIPFILITTSYTPPTPTPVSILSLSSDSPQNIASTATYKQNNLKWKVNIYVAELTIIVHVIISPLSVCRLKKGERRRRREGCGELQTTHLSACLVCRRKDCNFQPKVSHHSSVFAQLLHLAFII